MYSIQGKTHVMRVETICSLELTASVLSTALPLAQYRPAILYLGQQLLSSFKKVEHNL